MLFLTIGVLVIAGVVLAGLVIASQPRSASAAAIASPRVQLPAGLADGRTLGRADAPVTLELWADFQCPVCLRFTDNIEPLLRAAYVQTGAVREVFHDFAFIGQESIQAAAAARIADAKGPGFWPMHDLLYGNQGAENGGAFSDDRLAAMAERLGMDRTAFLAALKDPTYTDAVKAETAQGTALGVSSTPTLVIDGTMYPGLPTWDQLSALLDARLAAVSPAPSTAAS
ncbi:MAG: thioredoxin domain-containing protein [Chloroflexota bacterium]